MRNIVIAVVLIGAGVYLMVSRNAGSKVPSFLPELNPKPLLAVGERRIAAHWTHALALKPDDRLYGWGRLDDSDRSSLAPRVIDQGLTNWRYLSTSLTVSYAVTAGGELLRRAVWRTPGEPPAAELSRYETVHGDSTWRKVDTVLRLTVGLTKDGRLYAWSERDFEEGRVPAPAPVTPTGNWADFCVASKDRARRHRVYAIDKAGATWTAETRLDQFSQDEGLSFKALPAVPAKFQRIWCSDYIGGPVFLLDGDRHLWGFGNNDTGALSPELLRETMQRKTEWNKQNVPIIAEEAMQQVSSRRWIMVAPSYGFTVAIASDGSLWAWGRDYDGYIAKSRAGAGKEPILIDGEREWTEVVTAGGYIVARDAKGEIHTWGATGNADNPYVKGLLGDGGVAQHRDTPRPIIEVPAS